MGTTKEHIHSDLHNEIATIAKVFAHPARVAILHYVSQQQNCICNDIVNEVGLSQPTISQHLKVIKNAGLLKGITKGKNLCYCINTARMEQFQDLLNTFFVNTTNCCTT